MAGIETRLGIAPDRRRTRIKEAFGGVNDPAQRALRREYEVLKKLAECSVPEVLDVADERGGFSLVLINPQGSRLRDLLAANGGKLRVADALTIASAAVAALATIHAHGFIHCDVRPETLRVSEGFQHVTLTDVGDAVDSKHPSPIQGTLGASLPYIAPEQTGRINRKVDFRSDFYGLGITLFECLSGTPPFASDSPAELFHCHIARRPPSLCELLPGLPLAVSELVDRLLAKDPDARYQSHAGLRYDLDTLAHAVTKGSGENYVLGSHDAPRRLPIPARLFGREAAVANLAGALEQTCQGTNELFFVTGPSGIGKSALLNTLRRPTLARGGIFAVGKCDQLRRSPYDAPLQALRHALRTLLRGTARRLAAWRSRIEQRLGSAASVLADVIPELPLLLGKQQDAGALPPVQTEQRFRNALLQMIAALAAPTHPLVMVLDDIQWADLTTLSLIEELGESDSAHSVLLIGAYRDDEVETGHLLSQLIDRVHPKRSTNHERLLPLTKTECSELVAAMLPRSGGDIELLVSLVYTRSQGNPLFVHAFLHALVDQNLLRYETNRGGWWWQAEELHAAEISETLAALVARRLEALSQRTRRTLNLAACFGDRFSAELFAEVLDESPEVIGEDLWEAISAGLIAPITAADSPTPNTPYRFTHDRVQEAAYLPLSTHEREQAHLRIGRVLRNHLTDPEGDEGLFEVVRHLNAARAVITCASERRQLAELNLRAGIRARLATAYKTAIELLRNGLGLLPQNAWQDSYQLTYDLHLECMTVEHLGGHHDDAARHSQPLLEHSRTVREQVHIHLVRVNLEVSRDASRSASLRALEIGRAGLALLGVRLPTKGNQLLNASRLAMMHLRLGNKSTDELANLPAVDDPQHRLVLDLLLALAPPAYLVDPNLVLWIVLRMLNESLDHGISAPSAYALVMFGSLEVGLFGHLERAQTFAEAVTALQQRFPDPFLAGRIGFLSSFYLRCWYRPLAEVIEQASHYHA
ncbi:MAG: ATP-binding protein, partial [Nannocystaceae bacterium]